jgi:hypothetical protein
MAIAEDILTMRRYSMADEAGYKIEMLVKDIDKLRDAVHKLEVDFSTASQKIKDDYAFVFHKIDAISEKMQVWAERVEEMREKEIRQQGFWSGIKTVFFKHPLVLPIIFVGVLWFAQSDILKNHFLK